MFDKETLTALQESAAIAQAGLQLVDSANTKDLAALPSDYKLHDLEPYLPTRRRARGTMTTATIQAFAAYATEHVDEGATVFVDQNTMSATAVLNLGTVDTPGHADNRAVLKAERTAAYSALVTIANGAGRTQKEVAEFMEDWADSIKCRNGETDINTHQAVAAVRKITIESMRKLESEEQSLSASRSAFESVQASSTQPLPTHLMFICTPYNGLNTRFFELRLGVLTGEPTPKVNLRIIKTEEHQEEMAEELGERITDAIAGAMPVLVGTYSKGN